jgi:hypothetical protein
MGRGFKIHRHCMEYRSRYLIRALKLAAGATVGHVTVVADLRVMELATADSPRFYSSVTDSKGSVFLVDEEKERKEYALP